MQSAEAFDEKVEYVNPFSKDIDFYDALSCIIDVLKSYHIQSSNISLSQKLYD